MAIDLQTTYPGKVNPASPAWPFGQPKNIVAPGDGTGTPWEQSIIRDTEGFKQALLTNAGLTPSGTPDNAQVSQYYQAIMALSFRRVESIAEFKLLNSDNYSMVYVESYYGDDEFPQGFYKKIASSGGIAADDGGVIIGLVDDSMWQLVATRGQIWVTQYGVKMDGTNAADNWVRLQKAIQYLRHDPINILDTIGGSNITAYGSGRLLFPQGVCAIPPESFEVRYDIGLQLVGTGSRRTLNYQKGSTVLLIDGASSAWGVRTYRNGGRSFNMIDIELAYKDETFTGDLFDTVDSPGVNLVRCYLGTAGTSGATRKQSARSLIRATYDEFLTLVDPVFDGAVDMIWFDDIRSELGNTFGGSMTSIVNPVFYDCTGSMLRQDGNRTRNSVVISNPAFNPISVDCQRGVDLNNIDGLLILGGVSVPSVANKPTIEWMRIVNCSGEIVGHSFGDLAKAGTISGNLTIQGNIVFSTDGFDVTGGVIKAHSNEFSKATIAWDIAPTVPLSIDFGPDTFKNLVGTSYRIAADSGNLSGFIGYNVDNDASTSKFTNASARVRIENIDKKRFSIPDASYNISIYDTGRKIQATGGVPQTWALPAPIPGTCLTVEKLSGQTLTLNCAGGTNFYTGFGAVKTSASFAGADVGGSIELEAYATVGWITRGHGTINYV